jgi:hypothetical protein
VNDTDSNVWIYFRGVWERETHEQFGKPSEIERIWCNIGYCYSKFFC